MNTGIIPRMFNRIFCILWRGHKYEAIIVDSGIWSGKIFKCKYCGKTKIV